MALLLAAVGMSAASPAASTLSLSVWNNTAMAGMAAHTGTISSLSFSVPTISASAGPLSVEVTGTMTAVPNASYGFNCSFGGAQFGTLHIDDHLVCQWGANSDSVLTPGQGKASGCGGGGGHQLCAGVDNPLLTMSRTQLPVRMQLFYNPALLTPGAKPAPSLEVTVAQTTPATFVSTLPPTEVQRRTLQKSLLQGWGLFYDMSYIDAVLLPQGARVKFALCQTTPGGKCLTEARLDWPDKTGLTASLRPGTHAYDRSYTQMYVAVPGCNVSLTTGTW